MRISDWSSDVCSSDLYPRGSARIRGNLDIPGTRRQDAALCRSPFPRPSPIVGYRRKRERPAAAAVATAWDKKGRKAPRFRPPNSCADSLKRTAQPALPHRGSVTPFGRGLQGLSLRDVHELAEEPARVGDRIEIDHRSQPSYEQKGQIWKIGGRPRDRETPPRQR